MLRSEEQRRPLLIKRLLQIVTALLPISGLLKLSDFMVCVFSETETSVKRCSM